MFSSDFFSLTFNQDWMIWKYYFDDYDFYLDDYDVENYGNQDNYDNDI